MSTIEDLQAQLLKQVKLLEEERKKNAENFEKERNQLVQFAAMERAKQLEEYNRKIEEHVKYRAEKEAQEQAKARKDLTDKISLEQKEFELDQALAAQREKMAWLEQQISNAEFAEEQHRKSLENQRQMMLNPPETPADGSKLGEAATGTEGDVQSEVMSEHLKGILRLANR